MMFILPLVFCAHATAEDDSDPVIMGKKRSEWIQQLKDKNPANRLRAVVYLSSLGTEIESACGPLAACLKDDDDDVRRRARKTLLIIGNSLDGQKFTNVVLPMLIEIMKDPGEHMDPGVLDVIKIIGVRAKSAVPEMFGLFKAAGIRPESITEAIISTQPSSAIAGYAVDLLNATNASVRKSGEKLLEHIGFHSQARIEVYYKARNAELGSDENKSAVEELCKRLVDDHPYDRVIVAALLGQLEQKAAIPALTKALNDEDETVRKQVTKSLKQIWGERELESHKP
jgi:hypothetical protein